MLEDFLLRSLLVEDVRVVEFQIVSSIAHETKFNVPGQHDFKLLTPRDGVLGGVDGTRISEELTCCWV